MFIPRDRPHLAPRDASSLLSKVWLIPWKTSISENKFQIGQFRPSLAKKGIRFKCPILMFYLLDRLSKFSKFKLHLLLLLKIKVRAKIGNPAVRILRVIFLK